MKSANASCRRQFVWLPLSMRVCVRVGVGDSVYECLCVCVHLVVVAAAGVASNYSVSAGSPPPTRQAVGGEAGKARSRGSLLTPQKGAQLLLLLLLLPLLLLLLTVFPLGLLPDAVAIAVFCRHFFTVCSLGCSFVRYRLPVSPSPLSRSFSPPWPASLPPIRPQVAVPAQSPVAAPQCCLFFFRWASGGARKEQVKCVRGSPVR